MTVLYLHGFASSSASTKAGLFAARFAAHGVRFIAPDFNEPDFSTLTMTRMLDQLAAEVERTVEPVILMGSSLGGTLAILGAERLGARVERLVLLAPAVMFARPGHHLLTPERVAEWRARGSMGFFHYAYNEERPLRYAFYEDTVRYDAFGAAVSQPVKIFQGRRDSSVDAATVEAFASARPNVELTLLDDDHQLIASVPQIWSETEEFLGLTA